MLLSPCPPASSTMFQCLQAGWQSCEGDLLFLNSSLLSSFRNQPDSLCLWCWQDLFLLRSQLSDWNNTRHINSVLIHTPLSLLVSFLYRLTFDGNHQKEGVLFADSEQSGEFWIFIMVKDRGSLKMVKCEVELFEENFFSFFFFRFLECEWKDWICSKLRADCDSKALLLRQGKNLRWKQFSWVWPAL